MASTIRIKRSSAAGNPTTLAAGELAYSSLGGAYNNGGDRLYIGIGAETSGNAANHFVIGGKYFTDMLDQSPGTLTASSAIVVDSNSKIDVINVGNLTVTGSSNTISSTNTNGNIVLTPNGTGYVSISGTNGLVIPSGTTAQQGPAVIGAVRFNTTTTQFEGYLGSNWASLGGVRSVDNLTYIIAESSPGASDDIIHFYASNSTIAIEVSQLSTSAFKLLQTTANTGNATSGALQVAGGAGFAGNVYVGGTLTVNTTSSFTDLATFNKGITISGDAASATEYFRITDGAGTPVTTFLVDTSSGNTTIAGTLGVTGNTTVSGTLGVTGATTLSSTLGVTSNATVGGTLGVTGATTLSSTLGVTGASTLAALSATTGAFSGDVTVATNKFQVLSASGNTTIAGTLGVTGATTLSSTLNVVSDFSVATNKFTVAATSGNTAVAGTLGVTGAATLSSTLGVTGAATLSSTLGVTGAATLSSTLDVTGNFNINTNKFQVVAASGNTTVAGTLTVSSTSSFSGALAMNANKITGLADPTNPQDAATKSYVDATAQGLSVHAAVAVATTAALAGTVTYANGTSGVGATLTLGTALTTLDGYTLLNGDRILVKNQANQAHNGVYIWATGGTVLTRATDFDSPGEIAGGNFFFIVNGTTLGDTGWVQTEVVTAIGTTNVILQQFSGAGTYQASSGITLSGNTFSVNLATNSGLSTTSGLTIDSSVAGGGLTLTSGVLDVVGTSNRITVNADSIDIASTYVGQTSITTLGTIGTGTWNGTVVASAYGGTGFSTYAAGDILYASSANTLSKLTKGNDGQVLQMVSGLPTWVDLDGGTF
jgi:hypothetical protein